MEELKVAYKTAPTLQSVRPLLERKTSKITLDNFIVYGTLGKGSFGTVYIAKLSGSDKIYAIKAIRKDKLIRD